MTTKQVVTAGSVDRQLHRRQHSRGPTGRPWVESRGGSTRRGSAFITVIILRYTAI